MKKTYLREVGAKGGSTPNTTEEKLEELDEKKIEKLQLEKTEKKEEENKRGFPSDNCFLE